MATALIGLLGNAARAQTDAEVDALLAEALLWPDWDTILTATAGMGHTDNVFLSNTDPQSSPFVIASGEVFVLRLAPTGPRISIFANAEARYFFAEDVDYPEFVSFSQAMIEGDLSEHLEGSIAGRYLYQDQILDISLTETNRQPTPVLGHTIAIEPGLRQQLPGENWIGLTTPATRQYLKEPLDDYWEVGAGLTLGHSYRWDSEVALSFGPQWRYYDSEPSRTSTGEPIPGTTRAAFEQEARLAWSHYWDSETRWRTVLGLGAFLNTENGGGYSDYRGGLTSGRIQYRANGWEISLGGTLAHYEYENQTVSASDSALRKRTPWGVSFLVERQLSEKVLWRIRYEYETVLSNDPLETYDVNTLGMTFSYEF